MPPPNPTPASPARLRAMARQWGRVAIMRAIDHTEDDHMLFLSWPDIYRSVHEDSRAALAAYVRAEIGPNLFTGA